MRRTVLSLIVSFVLVFATAFAAFGGGFHFKSTSFRLGSLTFEGVGVGLGNSDYLATMDATATVRALCVNKGGNAALGRNDIFVSVPGPQDQEIRTEDNGKTLVTLSVGTPTVVDLDARPNTKKDCPNGKWSIEDVLVIEWTSAHVVITDDIGAGAVLYDQRFACSGGGVALDGDGDPISNGMGGYLLNPVSCSPA